tara:strand:+ start:964 stop:1662 length:699 start_codon:yes stop_codon:yes gene_type:complete
MSKRNVILFISDLHAPYHHKDSLAFLEAVKNKYKPTRVVNVGDEADNHALSFHNSDPDLDSAGIELKRAKRYIKKLEVLFPKMELVHSNHGSMVYRKAKFAGMPRHVVRPYEEVLGTKKWTWSNELILETPLGDIFVCHGKKKNSEVYAKSIGMSVVQGHYHEDFRIGYMNSPGGVIWGMNVGCLIDDQALAFEYNKINPNKPMLGVGLAIEGVPCLVPMILDDKGRWIGTL